MRGSYRKKQAPRINDQIRIPRCRLQGNDGVAYGIVSINEARDMAVEKGLDLVEVSPNADPPVVKLIDYGKFKYTSRKKASQVKKKQTNIQLKEIQFRPNIEIHDLEVKLGKIHQFLGRGDKVKMVMQFRGREMAYKEIGEKKFKNIIDSIRDIDILIDTEPKFMGNKIITIIAPLKKTKKTQKK